MTTKKTVLITGANQGLGFETAKQLAELGYYVYMGSRDSAKGIAAKQKLNESGFSNVEFIEIDVTDLNSIKSARQELEAKSQRLDVLINNAGISGGLITQNMSTYDIENLRKVFETNFYGAVQTTQQFIDLLKRSNEPRIVNVSSGLGSLGFSFSHDLAFYAYGCSKTALNAFTVSLAKELRDTNFKINSVEPGYTATNLNQYQGTQTPEQAVGIIVKYATVSNDAPTGKFFWKEGEFAW
ncbi:neomenthol dehydrogenase [Niastella vici]|uniref:Neomenthol dehydrogenase n=1 Tax=Niastella vici TaxID=1703345 RepID=A0A1V9FZJ5_9BACT|nr:SDR family oxidoreductase [Niastella vici]OQP63747.1 neomenthol dehydrogenase [Niastella vici]